MAGGGEGVTLEFTPTWVVALVCFIIVSISLLAERGLHSAGKYFKKKNQNPLYEALLKVKEELMLLGFISLLLTVSQKTITKMCVKESLYKSWQPCRPDPGPHNRPKNSTHFDLESISGITRRLLAAGGEAQEGYCAQKGKVPLLSVQAFHHLHIFIFVLAIAHVTFSAMTICFGGLKIRQWKQWEELVAKEIDDTESAQPKVTHVQDHDFVKDHYLGIGKNYRIKGWIHSFKNQFYGSVTKSDYLTLRLGFISTHCKENPKFDFHDYMVRALEIDFKKVVGISWYLWLFVVIFLLINVDGLHAYFWLAFIPFFLLLAVGTKLQHIITQLAQEVAEKHIAVEGDLIVQPSDEHFWFSRPRLVLSLIHFILFQNAFEMAFFIWIWLTYGFDSCIMGRIRYIVPRILIGSFIQILCSYSTLPLYAIVTQMGSNFKQAIFNNSNSGVKERKS
ncbi:MLO-like protein 1 [Rosa sericea]